MIQKTGVTPDRAVMFQREVAVRHDVDVFVAAGGPAGCAAAVMAKRQEKL